MILVTGSLAYDLIMNFPGRFSDHILADKIHNLNVSFLVENLRQERGGCAANIAYSLALLGVKPAILGVLGRDGGEYKKWLASHGVDVTRLKIIRRASTASAFIITDQADNQITGFYPGSMRASAKLKIHISQKSRKAGKAKVKSIEFVIIAPNDPQAMINFAQECQQRKLPYLFDPGMQLPRLTKKQLEQGISGAKMVIANDYEMSLINSRQVAGKKQQIWITTLGAKGSIINYQGKKVRILPAKPKNISDPTGAGDAYRAGFLAGYCRGFNLKTCGQMGSLTAVYTVEKYGTTTHQFTQKSFQQRYYQNFHEKINL